MIHKTCRTCKRKLPLSEFVTDSHASLGVKNICKVCYRDERKGYPSYPNRKSER